MSNTFPQQIHLHGDILEDYVVIFKELVKKLKVGHVLTITHIIQAFIFSLILLF